MFLRNTGLVVRWLVWKQPFLPFLTQPGHTYWPQKSQIRNSLNSILVKKGKNYIVINFVTLRLTKVKFLKITSFLPFLTQIGQMFGPKCPSNVACLAIFTLHFHSGVCTTTAFCFKRYSLSKIWKKLIDNNHFFTYFTTLHLAKFCPKTTPILIFFAGFQWNMLEDSISINNFNWNPVVLKNIC